MKASHPHPLRLAAIAIVGGLAIYAAARWSPQPSPRPDVHEIAARAEMPADVAPPAAPAPVAEPIAAPVATPTAPPVSPPSPPARVAAKPRRVEPAPAAAAAPFVPIDLARAALDAVGDDPDAEAVWVAAINDPALTPHQRSDLIEDLNENGFADPHHVTPDELPLVLARLELIEQLAPEAMDDVNAAAFAEAYKDLANIAERLMQ